MAIVTDPSLLAELNGTTKNVVTDPDLLAELNGTTQVKAKPKKVEPLTTAEKYLAPVLNNMFSATGLSSQPVQDVAVGASGLMRGSANLVSPDLGEKIWPSANSSGGNWETAGRFVDPVSLAISGGAMKALPYASLLGKGFVGGAKALGQNVLSGAASGGLTGALSDNSNTMDSMGTGALVSGAIPIIGALGGSANTLIQRLKGGAEGQVVDYLRKIFPNNSAKVAQALDELKSYVGREKPTAGLASVSSDTLIPELKVLEERARSAPTHGADLANILRNNQNASQDVIENIASPGRRSFNEATRKTDLSPFEQARQQGTDPLYTTANADIVNINPNIKGIVGKEGNFNYSTGGNKLDIGALQNIKNELTTRINALDGATDGNSKLLLDELVAKRQTLNSEMRNQSQNYAKASDAYKNLSTPQNQADVAIEPAKALKTNPKQYLQAVEEAQKTIKKAGGEARYQNLGEVMSEGQMRDIGNVGASQQRLQAYNDLKANSGIVPTMTGLADQIVSDTPNLINKYLSMGKLALRKLGGRQDEAAQNILNESIKDPKKLAELIRATPTQDRKNVLNVLTKTMSKADKDLLAASLRSGLVNNSQTGSNQ